MIDHMMFHVKDMKKSRKFYEAALKPLGMEVKADGSTKLSIKDANTKFYLSEGAASQHIHVAFKAKSKEDVDAFFASAIKAGGIDNGKPGPRNFTAGYYAAFVLDPDGNNIEAAFREH
jgi:predicted lactoylglutathione lyase